MIQKLVGSALRFPMFAVVFALGIAALGAYSDSQLDIEAYPNPVAPMIEIVPMRALAFAMAEIADAHRVSTLGAEAVTAAVHLGSPLCVWDGDDGPTIRNAAIALGVTYLAIGR